MSTIGQPSGPDLHRSGLWPAPNAAGQSRVPQPELFPGGDRSVWLSIRHSLRAQYDALALPIPPHIAALVELFETKNRNGPPAILPSESRVMSTQRRHWLDYDPVALAVLAIGIGIVELLALLL